MILLNPWFLFLQLTAVAIEVGIWYLIKTYAQDPTGNILYLIMAMVGYAVIVLLAVRMINYAGVGVSNAIWNVLSTLAVAGLGVYAFSESYSVSTCVGFLLGAVSIVLLGM